MNKRKILSMPDKMKKSASAAQAIANVRAKLNNKKQKNNHATERVNERLNEKEQKKTIEKLEAMVKCIEDGYIKSKNTAVKLFQTDRFIGEFYGNSSNGDSVFAIIRPKTRSAKINIHPEIGSLEDKMNDITKRLNDKNLTLVTIMIRRSKQQRSPQPETSRAMSVDNVFVITESGKAKKID